MSDDAARKDAVRTPLKAVLYWGLPVLLLLAGGPLADDAVSAAILWTVCFAWLGTACLANALKCGRRHCFLTGPFFLLVALAGLLHGTGLVPLGGFEALSIVALVGTPLLWILPDRIWGPYVRRRG